MCSWIITLTAPLLLSWSSGGKFALSPYLFHVKSKSLILISGFLSLLTGTFIVYMIMSAFTVVFVSICVPETKGKTLEEIQLSFRWTYILWWYFSILLSIVVVIGAAVIFHIHLASILVHVQILNYPNNHEWSSVLHTCLFNFHFSVLVITMELYFFSVYHFAPSRKMVAFLLFFPFFFKVSNDCHMVWPNQCPNLLLMYININIQDVGMRWSLNKSTNGIR